MVSRPGRGEGGRGEQARKRGGGRGDEESGGNESAHMVQCCATSCALLLLLLLLPLFLQLRHLEGYLSSQGRPCHIIWTSSVTAGKAEFNPADIQGSKTSVFKCLLYQVSAIPSSLSLLLLLPPVQIRTLTQRER